MSKTTIAVSKETRDYLRELGSKGETYDQIIRRLVRDADYSQLDEHWNRILSTDQFIPLDEL